jgi:ZIP family zinc transporter
MHVFETALLFALFPIAGIAGGGLLAEWIPLSRETLSYALHAAAGVLFAVVGLELMPQALSGKTPWIPIVAFALGGVFFVAMDRVTDAVERRTGEGQPSTPWMLYIGITIDLLSDGIMLGAGAGASRHLAFLLAISQLPANVPAVFAVGSTLRGLDMPRRARLTFDAALVLPVLIGTAAGYWAVGGRAHTVTFSVLAFTAGVLTTVVVEEMIPRAHRRGEVRNEALALIAGFCVFAALAAYV